MINTTERDNHVYYTSTFHPPASERANQFWFDLASREDIEIIPESGISQSFRVFDVRAYRPLIENTLKEDKPPKFIKFSLK